MVSKDRNLATDLDRIETPTEEMARHARAVVLRNARDNSEATEFCLMLGLEDAA